MFILAKNLYNFVFIPLFFLERKQKDRTRSPNVQSCQCVGKTKANSVGGRGILNSFHERICVQIQHMIYIRAI